MSNRIAIIPARKGSKGIKNKNIHTLNGETLISRTLNQAVNSQMFDSYILTTDYSEEELSLPTIQNLLFHSRGDKASSDAATALDVLLDLVECVSCSKNLQDATICYLQPTSPLRTPEDIRDSYSQRKLSPNLRVMSVFDRPVYKSKLVQLDQDSLLVHGESENNAGLNRQDFSDFSFIPNGALYWFESKDITGATSFPIANAAIYKMPWSRSIDIDSSEDLEKVKEILGGKFEKF